MNKSLVLASMFLAFAACSVDSTASMTVTLQSSYGSTGGGEILVVPSGFDFIPLSYDAPAGQFETFCLEINEYYNPGRTYDAVLNNGAVQGGVGGQDPPGGNYDPLDPMTAYLYNEFITGSLNGYNYDDDATWSYDRADSADALQRVIWFIEDEISQPFTTGYGSLEEMFYNDAVSAGWTDTGNVYVLNLYGYSWKYGCQYRNRQDMLVAIIPAPGAIVLGGIGIVLVGWLRKRRIL